MNIKVGKTYKYYPGPKQISLGFIENSLDHDHELVGKKVIIVSIDGNIVRGTFIDDTKGRTGKYYFHPSCLKPAGPSNKPGERC